MDEDHLRDAAGDYVAGDLDPADAAAFERLLERGARLRREVDFWRRPRAALTDDGEIPAPLADRVLRRRAERRRRLATRSGIASVAAAAGLVAGILLAQRLHANRHGAMQPSPPGTLAWFEDGSAVVMPWSRTDPAGRSAPRSERIITRARCCHRRRPPRSASVRRTARVQCR